MLEDETPQGVPTLVQLAQKGKVSQMYQRSYFSSGSCFMEALALFQYRVLYANVKNDVSVNYCTAAIVNKNPYNGQRYAQNVDTG